ncbi:MAG: molybdopterin molybdotransferase MoeA [Rhodobacteraceae bacterium]|nr:molybdopterin molybdotransferase MoeA [Paracoccaceae bacterium]
MISTDAALARILALIGPLPGEDVALADAAGRVLAAPARADRAQPAFAASAMDGYATRLADAVPGARLRVIDTAQAGQAATRPVEPGTAIRIFTGAPMPTGADRVVIQEDTTAEGDWVTLADNPGDGPHVRPIGADFAAGFTLDPPRRLRPADIALLAAMNLGWVSVTRRPVVALIATGDELVAPGQPLGPDQIPASNAYGLAALCAAQGAAPQILPIARDTTADLDRAFDAAAAADIVVTIGGASVGAHDLVRPVAAARGLDLSFWKVAMRPGKPLLAGRLGAATLIGLPGNPVSAMVCGHLFLRPAIDRALGLAAGPLPRRSARLTAAVPANGPREHFMRARTDDTGGVAPFPTQDSALLSVLAGADALLVRPPGDGPRAPGAVVDIVPLGPP